MSEDVVLDLSSGGPPDRREIAVTADSSQFRRAIQRDPAHQLGGHIMLRLAASLPDSLVRLPPERGSALGLRLDDRPQSPRQPIAASNVQQDRIQHSAKHVILALVERAVADSHWPSSRIARQVLAGRLAQVAPPVDSVHDLQPTILVRLEV